MASAQGSNRKALSAATEATGARSTRSVDRRRQSRSGCEGRGTFGRGNKDGGPDSPLATAHGGRGRCAPILGRKTRARLGVWRRETLAFFIGREGADRNCGHG